jgi:Transposase IS66 family
LYRQSAILERDTGVELSRSTLCGWVMRVGELLRPITRVMAEELLRADYLQADETPVGVQMHDRTARLISFLKRSIANDFRTRLPQMLFKSLFLYFLRVNHYMLRALCPWSTTYAVLW